MKRWLSVPLALAILLCGCAKNPATPEPSQATEPIATEPEGPNLGLYEPYSTVEILTSGAVRKFPLEGTSHYAMTTMGDGLLLFSGEEETTLTYLSDTSDPISVTLTGCYIYPDGNAVQVTDQGIGYYDSHDHTLVFLDSMLQESTRMSLPKEMINPPVLSADGQWIYYYADHSLRSLELRTGISRLLRESKYDVQKILGLHFDGSVLECSVIDGENEQTMFISTETGETLFTSEAQPVLHTMGQKYFAQWCEGIEWQFLFGTRGEKPKCLALSKTEVFFPLLGSSKLIAYQADETGTGLTVYDLAKGNQESKVRLSGISEPLSLQIDKNSGLIWFLADEIQDSNQALYCWDTTLSQAEDNQTYVLPYYTAEEPDIKGLEQCIQQAEELGEKYGIRIQIWEDAVKTVPTDSIFEVEYLVPVYQRTLTALDEALTCYPEEIFKKIAKKSANRKLTISLVRDIYDSNELGSQNAEDGVLFWDNGSIYIALAMTDQPKVNIYHELFHAIDSYVLTECTAFDHWEELNPKEFSYDYSYILNQYREDTQYLEGKNRAFIDLYSMSYPKEDRARIMEYAMLDGNKAYFESDFMQMKLKRLCNGIREAFGLTDHEETYLWEQYLKK